MRTNYGPVLLRQGEPGTSQYFMKHSARTIYQQYKNSFMVSSGSEKPGLRTCKVSNKIVADSTKYKVRTRI